MFNMPNPCFWYPTDIDILENSSSTSISIYEHMTKVDKRCQNVSKDVRRFQKMPKVANKFGKMPKYVARCQKMPNDDKIGPKKM